MTMIATILALAGIGFLALVWAMALRSLARIALALVTRPPAPRGHPLPI